MVNGKWQGDNQTIDLNRSGERHNRDRDQTTSGRAHAAKLEAQNGTGWMSVGYWKVGWMGGRTGRMRRRAGHGTVMIKEGEEREQAARY